MAIDARPISPAQRARILATTEGHFADLKAREIAPAKLTRTLSAFANADGGELHIGVAEDKKSGGRSWDGFANPEAANGHIQALEAFFPLGRDLLYTFLSSEGDPGLVLQVVIPKTQDIKAASDGIPYFHWFRKSSETHFREAYGEGSDRARPRHLEQQDRVPEEEEIATIGREGLKHRNGSLLCPRVMIRAEVGSGSPGAD